MAKQECIEIDLLPTLLSHTEVNGLHFLYYSNIKDTTSVWTLGCDSVELRRDRIKYDIRFCQGCNTSGHRL